MKDAMAGGKLVGADSPIAIDIDHPVHRLTPRGQAFFAIGLPFGQAETAIAVTVGGFENRLDGGRALGAAEAAVTILVELFNHVVTPQIMIFAAPFAVGKRGSGDGDNGQNGGNHH